MLSPAEKATHMTGSNMFLIFRHGVRLLGGEFLRSRGKAGAGRKNVNLLMKMAEHTAGSVQSNMCNKGQQLHGMWT